MLPWFAWPKAEPALVNCGDAKISRICSRRKYVQVVPAEHPNISILSQFSVMARAVEDEDIPLSDVASIASEEKGDIVPHQRLTINNATALLAAHKRIALPLSKLPFSAHQSITTSDPTLIHDINDDLNRELAFYKQSLSAVQEARRLLKAEDVPFSRPTDYFAEMVKSDEHMGRVRQKLVDVAASKKAAAEARKQRDLKKFGKQVQVEKRQERERAKKETLEKIQILKRSMCAPIENVWMLTEVQNERMLRWRMRTNLTCLMLNLKMRTTRTSRNEEDLTARHQIRGRRSRMLSGKRRTRDMDLAGRRDIRRVVMR